MKWLLATWICCLLLGGALGQLDPCPSNFTSSAGCACAPRRTGYRVDCFKKSINDVVAAIRREPTSFISTIQLFSLREITESVLPAGLFDGFVGLTSLTICCTDGGLTSIENNAFISLSSLETLDLSHNGLRWLSRSSFTGIGNSLASLDLTGNHLQNLRSDLQPFFSNIRTLTLNNNTQFTCDCHLMWLVNYTVSSSLELVRVNCSSPVNVTITDPSLTFENCRNICDLGYHNCAPNASCSQALDETLCTCEAGFTGSGTVCTPLPDPCLGNTSCALNATCVPNIAEQTYRCVCDRGFAGDGRTCTALDPCVTSNSCHQNATCVPDSIPEQTVICTCHAGFTGDGRNCTLLGDPCLTPRASCHENATCVATSILEQTFNCTCLTGFTGDGRNCRLLGDPCLTPRALCHENATCLATSVLEQTFNCTCMIGFTGDGYVCDQLEDPCLTSTACHQNATCVTESILDQTFSCVCNAGYTNNGRSCVPLTDPCLSPSACHQNATCIPDITRQTVTCVCSSGFKGNGQICTPLGSQCESCDRNAICTPDIPHLTGRCVCRSGYVGNGTVCVPIDPCSVLQCHPNATCVASGCVCNLPLVGDGHNCSVPPLVPCDLQCGVEGECVLGASGPYCVSAGLGDLQDQLAQLLADPSSDPGLTDFTTELATAASNIALPGDISLVVDLVLTLSNTSGLSVDSFRNLVSSVSELFDTSRHPMWFQLNQTEQTSHVVRLLMGLDIVGQQLFLRINVSTELVLSADNVAVVAIRPGCESTASNITVGTDLLGGDMPSQDSSSITLPTSVFGMDTDCENVGVVVVIYDGVGPLLSAEDLLPTCETPTAPLAHGQCEWYPVPTNNCTNRTVDDVVITANAFTSSNGTDDVTKLDTSSLLEPVRIAFQHSASAEGSEPSCAFLNEQQVQLADDTWLTEGCVVVMEESTAVQTVCECYHLTSFALLLSPTGTVTTDPAIQIVSKIGLCISIICLLITIVLLFALKLESKQLHSIHRQLAIALCAAQTLFLVGVDRTLVPSPDGVCTTIAVLLHYLFLCTFSWQLVEGIHLYIFVVKVFYNRKLEWLYYPLGWGLPAVVVAVTLGIRFCNYGSQHYCWITDGGGTNWSFHGPVIAVLAINIIIMFCVTYVIVRAARKKDQPDKCLLCTLLHASFVLIPILGITWALGFFVVGDSTVSRVIEWLFCIFTTLQGLMIFLMHCVLNKDVRKAFLKAIGCHEAARRQETVQNMRRSSAAYIRRRSSAGLVPPPKGFQAKGPLPSNLKFTNNFQFTLKKNKRKNFDMESCYDTDTDMMLSNFSFGHRLSLDQVNPGPLARIKEAAREEDYSLPSSVPCTPEQSPQLSGTQEHNTDTSSGVSST